VAALDVTDPARPGLAGSHDTPGYAHALARAGDRLYVADGRGGLRVLQVQVETGPAHAVYAPLAGKEIAP
jgi:hypothetical protein